MRPPAVIAPWLAPEEMQVWVREAPDKPSYEKRLAVWLTDMGRLPAHQVADFLCVSKQAVWLWIGQYNRQGPEGLERQGRGGRRWALLPWDKEESVLRHVEQRALAGEILTAKQLRTVVEQAVGQSVSLGYIYRLLHRHGWRKLGPRPRHPKAQPRAQEQFKKNSPDSWTKR